MDVSRVMMVDVLLKSDNLLPFFIKESGYFSFETIPMLKELRRASKGQTTMVSVERDRVGISVSQKEMFQHFIVPLSSNDPDDTAHPHISQKNLVYAKIGTKTFLAILRNLGNDYVELKSDLETLLFTRGEYKNYYARLTKDHDSLDSLKVSTDDQKSCYSTNYLLNILPHIQGFSDVVELEYSSDQPLKLAFDTKELAFKYWIAPRIEVE